MAKKDFEFDFTNKSLLSNLGGALSSDTGRGLIGAGIGGVLASRFAPKAPSFTPVTQATLDAQSIPELQQATRLRQAHLSGAQGAAGGRDSGDILENVMLRNQGALQIGQQRARNLAQATASGNELAQARFGNERQRVQDIISGATTGFNIANPARGQQIPVTAQPAQAAAPTLGNAFSPQQAVPAGLSPVQQEQARRQRILRLQQLGIDLEQQ